MASAAQRRHTGSSSDRRNEHNIQPPRRELRASTVASRYLASRDAVSGPTAARSTTSSSTVTRPTATRLTRSTSGKEEDQQLHVLACLSVETSKDSVLSTTVDSSRPVSTLSTLKLVTSDPELASSMLEDDNQNKADESSSFLVNVHELCSHLTKEAPMLMSWTSNGTAMVLLEGKQTFRDKQLWNQCREQLSEHVVADNSDKFLDKPAREYQQPALVVFKDKLRKHHVQSISILTSQKDANGATELKPAFAFCHPLFHRDAPRCQLEFLSSNVRVESAAKLPPYSVFAAQQQQRVLGGDKGEEKSLSSLEIVKSKKKLVGATTKKRKAVDSNSKSKKKGKVDQEPAAVVGTTKRSSTRIRIPLKNDQPPRVETTMASLPDWSKLTGGGKPSKALLALATAAASLPSASPSSLSAPSSLPETENGKDSLTPLIAATTGGKPNLLQKPATLVSYPSSKGFASPCFLESATTVNQKAPPNTTVASDAETSFFPGRLLDDRLSPLETAALTIVANKNSSHTEQAHVQDLDNLFASSQSPTKSSPSLSSTGSAVKTTFSMSSCQQTKYSVPEDLIDGLLKCELYSPQGGGGNDKKKKKASSSTPTKLLQCELYSPQSQDRGFGNEENEFPNSASGNEENECPNSASGFFLSTPPSPSLTPLKVHWSNGSLCVGSAIKHEHSLDKTPPSKPAALDNTGMATAALDERFVDLIGAPTRNMLDDHHCRPFDWGAVGRTEAV